LPCSVIRSGFPDALEDRAPGRTNQRLLALGAKERSSEHPQVAMPQAFSIWLVLRAQRPVHGTVYIDGAGLLVR